MGIKMRPYATECLIKKRFAMNSICGTNGNSRFIIIENFNHTPAQNMPYNLLHRSIIATIKGDIEWKLNMGFTKVF